MVHVIILPHIVRDYPKMRNLSKIFLRSFENVGPTYISLLFLSSTTLLQCCGFCVVMCCDAWLLRQRSGVWMWDRRLMRGWDVLVQTRSRLAATCRVKSGFYAVLTISSSASSATALDVSRVLR